ncbi:uncharacterized protein WM277_018116 isoform 2-T2 [Molossus nigricans]
MRRWKWSRSSTARGFGLVFFVCFFPSPGPLSRAARHDKDAGESAAGRALRILRAAPTKGSSPAARRLRCRCVGAKGRFSAPLSGPLASWRLFVHRAEVKSGTGVATTAKAPSREAAAAAEPAACDRPLVLALRCSLRAPPHPLQPLPPAHSARPPRARAGSRRRRRCSSASSRHIRCPAPRPAPLSYPLQPTPALAPAPAPLLCRASSPASWPIGGHQAAAVACWIRGSRPPPPPPRRSAPILLQPTGGRRREVWGTNVEWNTKSERLPVRSQSFVEWRDG